MSTSRRSVQARASLAGVDLERTELAVFDTLGRAPITVPGDVRLGDSAGPPRIEWRGKAPWKESPPAGACLWPFLRLKTATDQQIASFAVKWGVLGICKHGRPGTHDSCDPMLVATESWAGQAKPGWWYDSWYWEPLEAWRVRAGRFAAYLSIALDLRQGNTPRIDDWLITEGELAAETVNNAPQGWQANWVAQFMTAVLQDAAIYPLVRWNDATPGFRVTLGRAGLLAPSSASIGYGWKENTLFSALAAQLVVAAAAPLYRCDECRSPFQAQRRPRSDRRRYCPECSQDARLASKRRWWRDKGSGRRSTPAV